MRNLVRMLPVVLLGAWLGGCGSTGLVGDAGKQAMAADTTVTVEETPKAVVVGQTAPTPGSQQGLLGSDPQDDLSLGKKYFRAGAYGLAEQHFRRAVETHANDAEAWVGLAAAYDQLRRFDFADRAYKQAIRIAGPTPEIINNQGYSLMLRGKYAAAAAKFAEAARKAPENPYVKNNIRLLAEATHQKKAVE
jgi:Flp pilus assembly protein TadD